jgi:hypothetical protein
LWDLFLFERSFDGQHCAFVIKDEYSRKVWVVTFKSKDSGVIFDAFTNFEAYIRRQYQLSVCKIMQNRETSTIAIRDETKWQTWANEVGVDLELPLSHIYKPTGSIKRTGKKVQEKGLRMIQDANLPENL